MPALTAILHTSNDALRLGRALEMLVPVDEILVVDHGSSDATARIARSYGARFLRARAGATPSDYLQHARHDWILCLRPFESISESLQASLYEWKLQEWNAPGLPGKDGRPADTRSGQSSSLPPTPAFSLFVRQETTEGWLDLPTPETRIVPRHWQRWREFFPAAEPAALALEGELLRFVLP